MMIRRFMTPDNKVEVTVQTHCPPNSVSATVSKCTKDVVRGERTVGVTIQNGVYQPHHVGIYVHWTDENGRRMTKDASQDVPPNSTERVDVTIPIPGHDDEEEGSESIGFGDVDSWRG